MILTAEQREVLNGYFKSLGLNCYERQKLFRLIRGGGNWNAPLMILGDETTGKSTLKGILRYFGVCAYSPHECPCAMLTKRVDLSEEGIRYMRDIYEQLGIREKC